MIKFMNQVREIYYEERKKLSFKISHYNTYKKPKWMLEAQDHRFDATYSDLRTLYNKGRIALAHIVQANNSLYYPGKDDCPAALVYSEDPYFEENPYELKIIAHNLFKLKGTLCDDEELQLFSDILEDELVVIFNKKVPETITSGKEVYFSAFIVNRKHLPEGYIDFEYFPVLICPERTDAVIILPCKYWTPKPKEIVTISIINKSTNLVSEDPEKYIIMVDKFLEYAEYKRRISFNSKNNWKFRILFFKNQKVSALINYCKLDEAKKLIDELLDEVNIQQSQENKSDLYIFILSNYISVLLHLEKFEEAKRYIDIMENILKTPRKNMEVFNRLLKYMRMQLFVLHEDFEKGGQYLNELMAQNDNPSQKGYLLLYMGIYHYKRREKEKAQKCFDEASSTLKAPHSIKMIEHYRELLDNEIYEINK